MSTRFKSQEIPWKLLFIFGALVLGIGATGYLYFSNQRESIRQSQFSALTAIADLKVGQLVNWRKERMSAAQVFANDHLITRAIQDWQADPTSPLLKENIRAWLASIRESYDYSAVALLDTQGIVLLSDSKSGFLKDMQIRDDAVEAALAGKFALSDFHRDALTNQIQLDLAVPLATAPGREPTAILVLAIDPNQFLYPLIQSWPTLSPTGETLLVERTGNYVLFLNELRHRKNTALSLRFPITQEDLPAAKALRGEMGVIEGKDYRGIDVWSVAHEIPNSPWVLIAKIDVAEITVPIDEQARTISLFVGVLIFTAAACVGLIWRNQRATYYREMYHAEAEQRALVQQLDSLTVLNVARLQALLDLSQQAAALSEEEIIHQGLEEAVRLTGSEIGYFHFVNDDQKSIQLVTWSKEKLENCTTVADSHYPLDQAGVWADCARVRKPVVHNDYPHLPGKRGLPEGHAVLFRHASAPVIDRDKVRMILGVGNKITPYDENDTRVLSLVAEDIWKILRRKRAEETLLESEGRYRSLFENMLDGYAYCQMLFDEHNQPVDFVYLDVNSAFSQLTGLQDVVGKKVTEAIPGIKEANPEVFEIYGQVASTGHPAKFETKLESLGIWLSISVYSPAMDYFIAVFDNITARKVAEETIRQMIERLDLATQAAQLGVWDWDVQADRLVWDDRMYALYGIKRTDFSGAYEAWVQGLHPDDVAQSMIESQQALRGEKEYDTEFRVRWPDGTIRCLKAYGHVVRNGDGKPLRMTGINFDITEQKRYEHERETSIKLLRLINASNDVKGMMETVGSFLYDLSGCEAVGIRLRDGDDFPYFVYSGFPPWFVQAEKYLCARDLNGQIMRDEIGNPILDCMCGNILCGRFDPAKPFFTAHGSFWSNNTTQLLATTTEADRQARTRNRCNGEGYESVALIPLRTGDTTFGLIQLNDHRTERFTPGFISSVERLADSVAIALAQRHTAQALRESEERFHSLYESMTELVALHEIVYDSAGIAIDYRLLDCNPSFTTSTGITREQAVGALASKLYGVADVPYLDTYARVASTGKPAHFETYFAPLQKHFSISAFSPHQGRFATVASDITERKQVESRIQLQLERLAALRTIDTAITEGVDFNSMLDIILNQVMNQLYVDAVDLLLLNPKTKVLEFVMERGFRSEALKHTQLDLGEGYAGRAVLEGRVISVPDLRENIGSFVDAPLLVEEHFATYHAVPLYAKGEAIGVLETFHRSLFVPDTEWLNFLETLAGQTAIAIDNLSMFENLRSTNAELTLAYDATLEGWSRALDLRDEDTEGHTQRVVDLCLHLAAVMGVKEADLVNVRRGALLHDIGKMGIPDSILLKPGPLTPVEWQVMRLHPEYAYNLLSPIPYLRPALDIPYCHHERWDGSGYPRGLKGEDIPLIARIFAVVDVWDALTSDRPYREAWTTKRARDYIVEQAGKHFDPRVVQVFGELIPQPSEAQVAAAQKS